MSMVGTGGVQLLDLFYSGIQLYNYYTVESLSLFHLLKFLDLFY